MNYFEKIVKYICNELSGIELEKFIQEKDTNKRLAEDVAMLEENFSFLKSRIIQIDKRLEQEENIKNELLLHLSHQNDYQHKIDFILSAIINQDSEEALWLKNEGAFYKEIIDELFTEVLLLHEKKSVDKSIVQQLVEKYYSAFLSIEKATTEFLFNKNNKQRLITPIKVKSLWSNRFYMAAAAVAALIVLAGVWWFSFRTPTNEKLFAQYHTSYSSAGASMGSSNMANTLFEKGLKLFNVRQFAQAKSYFEKMDAADSNMVGSQFMIAMCFIEMDKTADAIPILERLSIIDNSNRTNDANWYLALCYIKNNQYEKAKPLLQNLEKQSALFAPRASALLKELQ